MYGVSQLQKMEFMDEIVWVKRDFGLDKITMIRTDMEDLLQSF